MWAWKFYQLVFCEVTFSIYTHLIWNLRAVTKGLVAKQLLSTMVETVKVPNFVLCMRDDRLYNQGITSWHLFMLKNLAKLKQSFNGRDQTTEEWLISWTVLSDESKLLMHRGRDWKDPCTNQISKAKVCPCQCNIGGLLLGYMILLRKTSSTVT